MKIHFTLPKETLEDAMRWTDAICETFFPQQIHFFLRFQSPDNAPAPQPQLTKFHTLWICLAGQGRILLDGVDNLLRENQALLIFPGQLYMRLPDSELIATYLVIRFSGGVLPSWLESLRGRLCEIPERHRRDLQAFVAAAEQVHSAQNSTAITETALRLGILLNQLHAGKRIELPVAEGDETRELSMRKVCSWIVLAQTPENSFKKLSKKAGMSPGRLRHVFKDRFGKTPYQLMQQTRYYQAVHLLLNTTLSVGEIAQKTNFASIYAFSRFFARRTAGKSPSAYRKDHRKIAESD